MLPYLCYDGVGVIAADKPMALTRRKLHHVTHFCSMKLTHIIRVLAPIVSPTG